MTSDEAAYFGDVLSEYIPKESRFYENICKAYDIFEMVRTESDGHGITFVIRRDEKPSRLDKHLKNARPYNGNTHYIHDPDIAEVVAEKREQDLATIVNSTGEITGTNVYLPADDVAYQERHGVECNIAAFMGFDPDEDGPGGRTISGLCASELIGDSVAILTLGETSPEGKKGEINIYYLGDRLYNNARREMRWGVAGRLPQTRREKVVQFPGTKAAEHYCGPGQEERRAVGGPV